MRFRSRQAAVVLTLAFACTVAPATLPRGGAPPRCQFGGVATQPTRASAGAILGRFWVSGIDRDELAWVDPVTLHRKSASSPPLPQSELYAVSPNGRLVAVPSHGVVLIDTRTLTTVATIHPQRGEGPRVLAWLSNHVLAGITREGAVLWSAGGAVLRRFGFGTKVDAVAWHAASDRLISLVAPASPGTGVARLISITKIGMDTIPLPQVRAGDAPTLGEHGTELIPGLAYNPADHLVFVIPPQGPIAEVALDQGTISYHELTHPLVAAISDGLLPSASAKLLGSSDRQAIWLGSGIVAVSGADGDLSSGQMQPVGVRLIDTNNWSVCVLDDQATHIGLTGGVLLAWGGPIFRENGGVGLLGWRLDDGATFHLFARRYLDVRASGRFAYATSSWNGWRVSTVNVSSGRAVAALDHRPPTVLPKGSSS
jgi:hypothetical protein